MSNTKEYSRMYYRTHIRAIKAKKKLYYAANRRRIIDHQIELNRKIRARKQAARASQKPVRESLHPVLSGNHDGARDTAPISGAEEPDVK